MGNVLKRSDGTIKVYGLTTDGKLMTVIMIPSERNGAFDIAEIAVNGKITRSWVK